MNPMWKCPHCPQTSNRRWNMQTHVLRKHNGLGTPANLMDNSLRLSTERHVINDNVYEDHQYQRNSKNNISNWRNAKSQNSRTDSVDSMDKLLETARKYSEMMELINRISHRRQSVLSLGLPISTVSSAPLPGVKFPRTSFPLMEDPLMDSVIAYKGYVCTNCLMKFVVPVYWFRETGKLLEVEHQCCNKIYFGNEILAGGRLPDVVTILYEGVLEDLRNVVNQWTQNRPYLVSELIPEQSTRANMTISIDKNNDWARRTIREGQTILSNTELVDFLRSSANQTCNSFNVYYEQEDFSQGPYMLCISRTPEIVISSQRGSITIRRD